ncbi:hypothetical protein JCM16358_11550 [Halanaerocella petrolearia]
MSKLPDKDKLRRVNPLKKPGKAVAGKISDAIDRLADKIFD